MINYIDISFLVLTLIFLFVGYKRGIFVSVLGLLRYAVGLPLCFSISNTYAVPLYNGFIRNKALELIEKKLTESESVNSVSSALQDVVSNMPSFLKNSIDTSAINFNKTDFAEQILNSVFEPILINIAKIFIFILVFILFFGATGFLLTILNKARKDKEHKNGKSSLSKADSFVGAVFGFGKALLLIFAITTILLYINGLNLDFSSNLTKQIDGSFLLPLIDRINPLRDFGG